MVKPLLLVSLLLFPLFASAVTLEGTTRWRGELTFREKVRVNAGATLQIAPGTTVTFEAGGLEVAGRLQADGVHFTGRGWDGIALKGVDAGTRLADCLVEGAVTGVQVTGGAPRLERLTLTGNQTGMELRQKTAARVSGCLFRGNRKVGLFIKDEAAPSVSDCRFEANGRFGAYIFRAAPQTFAGNRFSDNPTGLMVSHFGSDPEIRGNRFEKNETGILVEKAARPVLAGNLLRANGAGIRLSRRADPRVEENRLEKNRVGIEVSYSSYPLIRGNDLEGNGTALALQHQSAAWEEANGAAAREVQEPKGAFGQAPRREVSEADRRPRQLTAAVDARENWWGEGGSRELAGLGSGGNPSFIQDGRDTAVFVDGGKAYPLDRVLFAPWSAVPLTRGTIE